MRRPGRGGRRPGPHQTWRDKLEEIVCTHDDRVAKLAATRQETADQAGAPVTLDGRDFLGTLDAEPATNWPAVAEELARAEEDAARFRRRVRGRRARAALGRRAPAFRKSAAQDRAAGAQLRELLG